MYEEPTYVCKEVFLTGPRKGCSMFLKFFVVSIIQNFQKLNFIISMIRLTCHQVYREGSETCKPPISGYRETNDDLKKFSYVDSHSLTLCAMANVISV